VITLLDLVKIIYNKAININEGIIIIHTNNKNVYNRVNREFTNIFPI